MIDPDHFQNYQDLILKYEIITHHVRHGVEIVKAVLYFKDGTHLRISEVYEDREIKKYSYYWLDEHNEVLIGWDHAAHHASIETFPHHRHREGQIEPSQEQNLQAVLRYISERISGRT